MHGSEEDAEGILKGMAALVRAGSRNWTAVISLIVVCLSFLGAFLFGNSSDLIRVTCFVLLVASFSVFGILLIWNDGWRQRRGGASDDEDPEMSGEGPHGDTKSSPK